MNEKLEKLYNLYKQNGIIQSTDFNTFSSASEEQKRKLYDLGRQKGLFNSTDYNTFSSAFKPIKKKEPSASPSAQNQKPTSSVTQETKKPKPSVSSSVGGKFADVSNVVESQKTKDLSKKDGIYIYEGRPGALYKKSNGRWFVDPKGIGKFTEIPSDKMDRINLLEKQAKQAYNTGFEDEEIKPQRATTFKDKAPTLEQEMKQEVFNEDFFVTPKENMSSIDQVDFVSTEKAKRDMKEGDTEEDFIALKNKYTNSETLRMLDRKGFTVDMNEDMNSPKNKKAMTEFNASEELRIKSNAKTNILDKHVSDIVNAKLMGLTEERAVPLLNKSFGKYGFVFEESGIGDAMTVKYSKDGFNYSDPISIDLQSGDVNSQINSLKSFIKNKYVSDYDDYQINAGNIDINKIRTDDESRRKYFGQMADLMASNPSKYGEYLFSEGEFDNYIEGEYRLVNSRKKDLQSDMNKYDDLVSKYRMSGDDKMLADIQILESNIKEKQKGIIKTISQLESTEEKYKSAVGEYVLQKEKQGSFFGGMSVSFGKGIMGNLTKTGANVSSDILTELLPYGGMSPSQYQQYKDQGLTDSEISDMSSEKIKRQFKEDIDEAVSNVFSLGTTTSEYVSSSDRTLIEQAVNGLAESVGTAMSAGGNKIAQGLAFFNMSYSAMQDELASPEFDEMTKWEKQGISALYGLIIGKLEKIGFNAASGQTKSELFKRLSSGIISNALKDMPENATISTIDEIIGTSLQNTLKASGVKIVNGFLSEGTTEGIQSLAESGMKDIVNKLHGKNMFSDVPDITTEEGLKVALNKSLYEAAAGGIGGSIMGGFDAFKRVPANKRSDSDFEKIYGILMDDNLRRSLKMNEVIKYRNGEVSSDQVKQTVRDIDNDAATMGKIPTDLSVRGKRIAFELLSEKQQLEKEIAGKDENLTSVQRERISKINTELQKISQNAVQEQTTGEVSVQPETTTGQEVEGGKPTAELKKPTQEEITAKEKELDSVWSEKNKLQDKLEGQGLTEDEIRSNEDFRSLINRADVLSSEIFNLKDSIKEEVAIDKPTIATNATVELDRVKSVDMESEDGATFNLDGTKYEGGGLIVPVASTNTTIEEITPEMIADFVEANSGKIGDKNTVKVGIYKFPNSNKVSIDLNVVAPESSRDKAIEFGKQADQESLFDLSTFENVKTGGTGMNPMQFTDDQFKEIAKALNEGRVPNVFGQQQSAGQIDMDTTLSKIKEAAVSGNKMAGSMYKAIRSSMQAMPGVKIFVHDSKEAYQEAIARSTGQNKDQVVEDETNDRSAGTILENGEIHIDASIADAATVYHEMFHYAAMQMGLSAADIRSLVDAVKSSTKNKELIARAEKFANQYEDKSIEDDESLTDEERDIKIKENKIEVDDEFFTELGALLTASEELLQPKNIQKFFTIINNMFKKLGLPAPFTSASTRQDAIDFINSLSKGMREGTDAGISGQSKNKTGDSKRKKQAVTIMEGKESMEKFGLSKGKNVTRKIGEALEARQRAKYGTIDQKDNSAEAKKKISNWMVDEVKYFIELMGDKSGKGWYGELYQKSLDAMSKVFPEMKTDQNARDLFTMLVAITSDGQKVMSNFKLAAAAYDYYKKNGVMPSTLPGQRVASFEANLSRINKLLEEYNGDIASIKKDLMEVKSIEEINKERKKEGLEPLSTNWPVSFKAPFAASVFGPKLGMFYSNLSGNEAYPTLDRWWSRTFNRYRGTLIPGLKGGFNKKGEALGLDRFKQLLGNSNMSNEEALLAAKSYRDSYAAKGYKSGTDIEKAANTIYKIAFENLNDAPFTKNDRQFMYDTVSEAVNKLNKQGYELSIADVQAILWYFEKNLYKTLGVQAKIEGISYEDAANYTYDKWKEAGGKFDYKIDKSEEGQSVEDADEDIESESMTRKKRLAPKVAEKLTEDGNGNYVFQHWSSQKRDVIKPGTGQNSITGKDEASSLSAVGGLAQYYTMKDQSESGTGNVLHTVLVPMDKVYDAYNDPMGFAEEARRQFNEVRPGQGFDEGYRAAFITKVANENGYDMTVYPWRNTELRAQTTLELKPEKENIEFKDRTKEEYNVGDKINVYGEDAVVTSVEGPIVRFKSETSEGSINVDRSPRSIRKKRKAPNGKPSNLNEQQWKQVRTPEFKAWFGDWENDPENASKVVDENGEPLVVYHGTVATDIEEFDRSKSKRARSGLKELGLYFSTNKKLAELYSKAKPSDEYRSFMAEKIAELRKKQESVRNNREYEAIQDQIDAISKTGKVYPVFLNLRNIHTFNGNAEANLDAWRHLEVDAGYKIARNREAMEFLSPIYNKENNIEELFGVKPVDGIKAENIIEMSPGSSNREYEAAKEKYLGDAFLVFDGQPQNIKSATENVGTFSSSEVSIKKRKAPKNEAISKAKEKYDISIDRGNSVDQARKSAMSDLKKNDWYANATDIEREDAVRDLRKFFGLKEKSAPSVKKVLGKADSKTVTMNVSTLRDEFIKARGAAAKQAAKSIKDVQREIAAKIKDMVKSGKVSAKQAAILTDRLARLNTENPLMVERYLAYAEKVFENADYAQRLSDAFSIRKKIKRLSKSPNNQAEVRAMGKAFLEIDPSMVDDIDVYNEMAQMIFDALKPSRVSGTDAIYKSAALIEDVNIYTNEMVSMQEDKKKKEMLNLYSELVSAGVLSEDMSFKDIQTIISKINENPDIEIDDEVLKSIDPNLKKGTVEDYNKKTFDMLSAVVGEIINTGVDPITGDKVEWDEKAMALINRLMNMDISRLSVREQFMAIEALQNFMVNGITSGVEATVYAYDGALNAEKAANEGIKARDLRVYLSKMAGRMLSENFATIPVLFDSMFGGVRNGGRVMEAMGLSKYSNGVAKATKVMNNIVNEYGKAFSKKKPNGESFNSAKNVYERGMLAFLKRTVMGSDTEMNEELARRINLLRDSIKELRKGGDSDMKKADIYEELFSKLGLDREGISIIDIESRVDKINRDAVDWWIGKWSEHYPDLYDVSLSVFNTQLGKDLNYTPDRFSKTDTSEVMSKTEQEEMLARAGAFSINMDFTDKNKSGVLMEATRPKKTPGRYVDLDFDMSNSNAMKAALIDINTAGVVRQIDSFLRSDAFKSMIPNKKDYTLLRSRVNSYIRRTKGKDVISNDSLRELNKVTNVLAGLGSTKALGGILQPIKQTLPVIMNTLINAGRFNPMSVMDKGYNEWLDNSGMSIANRGLESSASIDTANKYLDKAADGGVETVLKYANKLNEMWLKVFLSKPDVVVARASFQAYYKQDLKRQGISTDIDWTNHEINQEAANYAQHMVDRQQNVSDAAMGGEFMASNDTTKKLVRKVAMPFANFVMNQKNRMYSDIRTLQNGMATKEDKRTAGRSLIGLTVEMISYQVITYAIGRYIASKAAEIAGYIPGDDDEEKQEKYAMQRVVSQGAKDFLSPIPLFDGATLAAFNYVSDQVQDVANWAKGDSQGLNDAIAMKNASLDEPMTGKDLERFKEKWLEEKKWKFEDFQAQSTFGFDLGTLTIVLDKLEALKELATVAKTGEFIKEYNGIETKQYLMEEDRSILKPMVAVEALHILGALPVEASSITRNVEKFVKKKGITEAQKDKYDLVKKKYGKVEPWMMEIVKSKKREDGTIQEIEWVKSFGDLNEKQGSKYVEIFKKREGQVTYDDMMRISKMK